MPVLANSNPTLIDIAASFGSDGKVEKTVAELLSQTNEVLQDMVLVECNSGQQHKAVLRTGLPKVFWRSYNQGVPASKSTTTPFTASCSMMEHYFEVDADLVNINNNKEAFLLSQEKAIVEAMGQEQANTLFYGSKNDGNRYVGFAESYSSLAAGNGSNILNGGGAGNTNTSVWLVGWGDNTVYGIYPKGSKSGLQRDFLGKVTKTEFDNNQSLMHEVIRTRHSWHHGLMIADWRYVVRIANLETAEFAAMAGTQDPRPADVDYAHNIVHLMARAIHHIPHLRMGRLAFYANRSVHSLLTRMSMERNNYVLTMEKGLGAFGQPMVNMSFMGIPIRLVDVLRNNEATVV